MSRTERTITQLEWYSVTYRSVVTASVLGAVALVGGLLYWYYAASWAPRESAAKAIATAQEQLETARPLADAEQLAETLERAGQALESANVSFASRDWADARFSALHSTDLSKQALAVAKGNKADPKMVRFYRMEGDVRVKHAGQFSWEQANPQLLLSIGDQVKTSSSGSAQLIYFDGTVTTIQPGSLLEIRDLFEDPVTKVRRVKEKLNFGEVRASTTRSNVQGSFHEVTTAKVAARSEKAGEFRMSFDPEKQTTTVDAFSGQVEVHGEGSRESLNAGERVRASAEGKLVNKEALPGVPRLLTPADQRVFIYENPTEHTIKLSWEPIPGVKKYHLMIADRPLFTDPLYDAVREGTDASLEVGPGTYYWKAAAINAKETPGPFSDTRGFRVSSEKIRDRDDSVPPELEITEFVTIGMMVIVNGRSEPGATLWVDNEKVDVFDDGRFYAVVRLRREGLNDLLFRAQDTAGNETRVQRAAYVEVY